MRCIFLLSLLFVLSSSLEDKTVKAFVKKPNVFASVLSKIEPNESQKTADDVRTLITVGQEELRVAQEKLDAAQAALDTAKAALDKATGNRAAKDQEIADIEAEIARLTALKSTQQTTMEDAQADRLAKDREVPIKAGILADENERIDREQGIFLSVITKLQGLLEDEEAPEEEPEAPEPEAPESEAPESEAPESEAPEDDLDEAIQVGRKLLAVPSLMEILNAADPEKVQTLIDLLNTLIDHGEDQRQIAITAWNDAVDAADAAATAQTLAESAHATTSGQLTAQEGELASSEAELVGLKEVENSADGEHKAEQVVFNGKQAIYNEEEARIVAEEKTFNDAIADLEKLESVVQLLA